MTLVNFADYEEQRFRAAVQKSWKAAFRVAEVIHSKGDYSVFIEPLRIRKSQTERNGFGDTADVKICKFHSNDPKLIEVKWKDLDFTCAEDYPYDTVFLDRGCKADAVAPYCYFVCNKALTVAAVAYWKATREHWIGPNKYFDSRKGYEFSTYECPKHLVKFESLVVP